MAHPSTFGKRTGTPEDLAAEAARLVNGTPAAAMFGETTRLLFRLEAAVAGEDVAGFVRQDLDSLHARLQVIQSSLIEVARLAKRLQGRAAGTFPLSAIPALPEE